jgi:hypothetical protein
MKLAFPAVLILALSFVGCGVNTSPGNGEKIGQIVKISKQGMMSHTWEAQLIRGGMNGGSGSFGTVPFDFTIENDADAEKATQFMQNQTEVVIHYRMEGIYSSFRTESDGHFLVSIEPAKK